MSFETHKAQWFEDNGNTDGINYNAEDIAPHADTQRAIYTVPAGKKAKVQSINVSAMRKTAPGTSAAITAYIQTSFSLNLAMVRFATATVGESKEQVLGDSIILDAGDTISIRTLDASTTGTVDYNLNVIVREFDA